MCLKIKSTKASDLFGNKEKITCWKTLSSSGTSIYWGTKYYLGENTSNRINTELSFHEETVKLVNNGIHVFTDKTFATKDRYNSEIVVAVTCHKKDFIGTRGKLRYV
jgi:hypothetical protein